MQEIEKETVKFIGEAMFDDGDDDDEEEEEEDEDDDDDFGLGLPMMPPSMVGLDLVTFTTSSVRDEEAEETEETEEAEEEDELIFSDDSLVKRKDTASIRSSVRAGVDTRKGEVMVTRRPEVKDTQEGVGDTKKSLKQFIRVWHGMESYTTILVDDFTVVADVVKMVSNKIQQQYGNNTIDPSQFYLFKQVEGATDVGLLTLFIPTKRFKDKIFLGGEGIVVSFFPPSRKTISGLNGPTFFYLNITTKEFPALPFPLKRQLTNDLRTMNQSQPQLTQRSTFNMPHSYSEATGVMMKDAKPILPDVTSDDSQARIIKEGRLRIRRKKALYKARYVKLIGRFLIVFNKQQDFKPGKVFRLTGSLAFQLRADRGKTPHLRLICANGIFYFSFEGDQDMFEWVVAIREALQSPKPTISDSAFIERAIANSYFLEAPSKVVEKQKIEEASPKGRQKSPRSPVVRSPVVPSLPRGERKPDPKPEGDFVSAPHFGTISSITPIIRPGESHTTSAFIENYSPRSPRGPTTSALSSSVPTLSVTPPAISLSNSASPSITRAKGRKNVLVLGSHR